MIWIAIAVIGFIVLATKVCWKYISQKTLDISIYLLILSLPLERIPSLEIAGSSVKIGQILVLMSVYFASVLLIKQNVHLLKKKVHSYFGFIPLFFLVSSFSLFNVVSFPRYIITEGATVLVFLALLLIGICANSLGRSIKHLLFVMVAVSVFGLYQLVGDFAGIPFTLTGLRENYTKVVFGIARVHATAIEPLYFAGMLALPLFYSLFSIRFGYQWFPSFSKFKNSMIQIISLTLFSVMLILTISKGAIAIMLAIFGLILLLDKGLQNKAVAFTKFVARSYAPWVLSFFGVVITSILVLYNQILPIVIDISQNVVATLDGTAASSAERRFYFNLAIDILPDYVLSGIGSGQFGVYVNRFFGFSTEDGGFLIVNNIYLEVLLERGFVALVIFALLLLIPIFYGIRYISKHTQQKSLDPVSIEKLTLISALSCALLANTIQWLLFSPIYIMPIFILLGLLTNCVFSQQIQE